MHVAALKALRSQLRTSRKLEMIARRFIMIWTRKSCVVPTVCAVAVLFLLIQTLLNREAHDEVQYSIAAMPDHVVNREIRKAAAECNTEFLSQSQPKRCDGSPFLLVIASSSPNHFTHRNMLRNYFGSRFNSTAYFDGPLWRIVFLVSKTNNLHLEMKVKKEIELNGDILHSRFRETRSTQVYKSIIGFSWSFCQCPAKYIIRIEEDVFLNLKILVHYLLTNDTGDVKKAGVYTGVRSTVDIPMASDFGKAQMPNQQYSEYYSLPIILSQAYLLSMDVLQGIVPLLPQYHIFSTNDVYIAFLIKKTGVRAVNKAGFLEQIKPNLLAICDYRRIFVSFDVVINDYPTLIEESTRSEFECLPKITLFPRSNKTLPQG